MLTKLIIVLIVLNHVESRKYAEYQNTDGLVENNTKIAAHKEYTYNNNNNEHHKLRYQTLTKEQLENYKSKLSKEHVYTESWENAKNYVDYLQVLKDLDIPKNMYEPFIFSINKNAEQYQLPSIHSVSDVIDSGVQINHKEYDPQNEEKQAKSEVFIIGNTYKNNQHKKTPTNIYVSQYTLGEENDNANKYDAKKKNQIIDIAEYLRNHDFTINKTLNHETQFPSKSVTLQEYSKNLKSNQDNADNARSKEKTGTVKPSSFQYFYNYVPDVSNFKDNHEALSNVRNHEYNEDKSSHKLTHNEEEPKYEHLPEQIKSEKSNSRKVFNARKYFGNHEIAHENGNYHDNTKNKEDANYHKESMKTDNDNLEQTNHGDINSEYPESYQSYYSYVSPKYQFERTLQKNTEKEVNFEANHIGTKNKSNQYKLIRDIIVNHMKLKKSHNNVNHSDNKERNRKVQNKNIKVYNNNNEDDKNTNLDIVEGPRKLVYKLETDYNSKNNHKNQEINYNLENAPSQYINNPKDQKEEMKKSASLENNRNYSDSEENSYVLFYRNIAGDAHKQVPLQYNNKKQTVNKQNDVSVDAIYFENEDITNTKQPDLYQSHRNTEESFVYEENPKFEHLPEKMKTFYSNTRNAFNERKQVHESLSSKQKDKSLQVFETKVKNHTDNEYNTENSNRFTKNLNSDIKKQFTSQNDEFAYQYSFDEKQSQGTTESNDYYLETEEISEKPLKAINQMNYKHHAVTNQPTKSKANFVQSKYSEINPQILRNDFKYEDKISGTNYNLVTNQNYVNNHSKSSPILNNFETTKNRTTKFSNKSPVRSSSTYLNNQYQEPNILLQETIVKSQKNEPSRKTQPTTENQYIYNLSPNSQNVGYQNTDSDLKIHEKDFRNLNSLKSLITNNEAKSRLVESYKLAPTYSQENESTKRKKMNTQKRNNQRNNINRAHRLKHRQPITDKDESLNNDDLHNHYNYEAVQENTKFIPIRPRKMQRRRKLRRRNRKQNQARGNQQIIQQQFIESSSVHEGNPMLQNQRNKHKSVDVQNNVRLQSYRDATPYEMTISEVTTITTLSEQFAEFGKKLVPRGNSQNKYRSN